MSLTRSTEPLFSFTEWCSEGFGLTWRIMNVLESLETPYQRIELFETLGEGKLLVHDGAVMLTERFEETYHEMLVHPAMLTHPNPRRVLVIGGGDGGALREVVRHEEVEIARQFEIDREVVRICQKHLPTLASAYDHPKVDLVVGDGIKAVADADSGSYEVVLIDSTDPVGPAVPLFEEPFYRDVYKTLADDGVMVTQIGNYAYHREHLAAVVKRLRKVFPLVRPYRADIPMYPSGTWSFAFASKGLDPLRDFNPQRDKKIETNARIWNREFHRSAFAFPNEIRKLLEDKIRQR